MKEILNQHQCKPVVHVAAAGSSYSEVHKVKKVRNSNHTFGHTVLISAHDVLSLLSNWPTNGNNTMEIMEQFLYSNQQEGIGLPNFLSPVI